MCYNFARFEPEKEENMSWFSISQILVFVTTFLTVIGLYMQALKLWQTKSVDDFDQVMVVALLANEIVWLNYGIQLKEWPIIAIPILSIPAACLIVVGYFKFRTRRKNEDRKTFGNSQP